MGIDRRTYDWYNLRNNLQQNTENAENQDIHRGRMIDQKFIKENLEHYSETQGLLPEKLREFGEKYKEQGYLNREQLYQIAYESSTRSAHHVKDNKETHCKQVTSKALDTEEDFAKIGLITLLKGFKVPTASCVLTSAQPKQHAVVDTRVWASLERKNYLEKRRETFQPRHYEQMMKHIREIAEKTNYTTEKVGYALFAYDDKVRKDTLH